jgi:hypothetical protein
MKTRTRRRVTSLARNHPQPTQNQAEQPAPRDPATINKVIHAATDACVAAISD